MRITTLALLLALTGCGDGDGTAAAPTEAPLCEPPADLACPEGMRADPQQAGDREGVWCWEGEQRHPLYMRVGGEMAWYSPPPFDVTVGCWPPDVAETAYLVTTVSAKTSACYDQSGTVGDCAEIEAAADAAWNTL